MYIHSESATTSSFWTRGIDSVIFIHLFWIGWLCVRFTFWVLVFCVSKDKCHFVKKNCLQLLDFLKHIFQCQYLTFPNQIVLTSTYRDSTDIQENEHSESNMYIEPYSFDGHLNLDYRKWIHPIAICLVPLHISYCCLASFSDTCSFSCVIWVQ